MDGKICVVTGATSGIGKETARGLVRLGARVAIVGRNPVKSERVASDLRALGPVDVLLADLSSLEQTRRLAGEILERYPRIDVLLSNAGVYRMSRRTTVDGHEETFAVNHLAPFLLTNLLLPRLIQSAPARIVVVASGAHSGAVLDFADLMLTDSYGHWRAYSRSKLANIMFTYALARRLEGTGVTANCLHPGFVASNFGSGNFIPSRPVMILARPLAFSPRKAAELPVWLASSPDLAGLSGRYFASDKFAPKRRDKRSNEYSHDVQMQERLWKESASLVGLD